MSENIHLHSKKEKTYLNINELFLKVLYRWKWFVISAIITITLAYVKLKFTTPLYEGSATILIEDKEEGGSLSDLPSIQNLGVLNSGRKIDNEIEILKSRSLMTKVVKALDLNIQFFVKKGPIEVESYKNPPLNINFPLGKSSVDSKEAVFYISPLSSNEFILKDDEKHEIGKRKFGTSIELAFGTFILTPNNYTKHLINKDIQVRIYPVFNIADGYRSTIQIFPINKLSDAIQIALKDNDKNKIEDVINTLISQYKLDAIEDKNQVSINTTQFIDDRLQIITKELSEVESNAESFKAKHKLVNVTTEAETFFENNSQNERNIIEINTQLYLADFVLDYLKKHNNIDELIPTNLGISDNSLTEIIQTYNTLVIERNRLSRNSTTKNPVVNNIENQIISFRKTIKEGIQNLKSSLKIQEKELTKQEGRMNSKIASVPKYEREFRNIQRQQQIKETLYLYLLQKREETAISMAVTISNTKVLDEAYSNGDAISPNKRMTIVAAFFIGLLIPFTLIILLSLFDSKINGKNDVLALGLPYIGDIPLSNENSKLVVKKGARTSVAEAFRLLRTNINFLSPAREGVTKTIFVTSTISNEGKSFIALNLASTLSLTGKKVLLMGMDLRAPKLLEYLDINSNQGVTNYIVDDKLKISDITLNVSEFEHIDIIPSGPIPPNPAELLMTSRVKDLFTEIKEKYDYVIVDTAPVGMVADTLLLNEYADMFVYVSRANFIDKRLLNIPYNLYKENKLKNMAILINCSDYNNNFGYGYGYGYGYGEGSNVRIDRKESLFKKLIKKINK